jgi:hypothetical protein
MPGIDAPDAVARLPGERGLAAVVKLVIELAAVESVMAALTAARSP